MSEFVGIKETMKNLGFVVLSCGGYYHLYIADIRPRTSLVVEGEFSTQNSKLYFDIYLMTKDIRSNETKINVVYGNNVPVVIMVKIATKQANFWKEKLSFKG